MWYLIWYLKFKCEEANFTWFICGISQWHVKRPFSHWMLFSCSNSSLHVKIAGCIWNVWKCGIHIWRRKKSLISCDMTFCFHVWTTITCENVQFARDISNALSYIFVTTFLPDSNNLAPVQIDSVHLSDEDGGHGLIKRCAVHVDCGTDWEDETRYSLVDAQVLFQASEGDRQGTSTAVGGGIKKTGRYILLSLVT